MSLFDATCSIVAPAAAFLVRDQGIDTYASSTVVLAYVTTAAIVTCTCVAVFDLQGIVSRFFTTRDILRICQASGISVVLTGMLLFTAFRLDTIARAVPVVHAVILAGLLIAGRMLARQRRRKKDFAPQDGPAEGRVHTIVIGANTLTRAFLQMAREVTHSSEVIIGILTASDRLHGRRIAGCPVLGGPDQLASLIEEYEAHGVRVDRIVVTDEAFAPETKAWAKVREAAHRYELDVGYLPDILVPVFKAEPAATVRPPAMAAHATPSLYWTVRRGIDVVGASALLVIMLPVFLLTTVAVLCELGFPAIFWQQRLGRGRRPIKVYKFRTLQSPFDRAGRPLSGPRVGPVGRFLRATRLDELPQLYNIAIGEMSFIGPRPLLPIDQPDRVDERLSVRPGLTGLAQVQGGRYLTREEKAELDLRYIQNASFALDAHVLLRTVQVIFTGDKAPDARPLASPHPYEFDSAEDGAGAELITEQQIDDGASDCNRPLSVEPGNSTVPRRL